MRRWMEFGWNGDFAAPHFELNSNTKKQGPKPQGQGDLPPIFLSFPVKQDLLDLLQGVSLYQVDQYTWFPAQIASGGSTDAPAGDCTAEHVVAGPNTYGWKIDSLYLGGFWQMLFAGFPKHGGGFTPALFTINLEPPSENG